MRYKGGAKFIEADPDVMIVKSVFIGTRITVELVLVRLSVADQVFAGQVWLYTKRAGAGYCLRYSSWLVIISIHRDMLCRGWISTRKDIF